MILNGGHGALRLFRSPVGSWFRAMFWLAAY